MKQINLDTEICVRLTDQGDMQLMKYSKYRDTLGYRFESGKLYIKLWAFMYVFGPNIMGNHFIDNDSIIVEDEAIKDYDQTNKTK